MSDQTWAKGAERVRRDWGFELPESLFRFLDWYESLDRAGSRALGEELEISPFGVTDVLFDPDAQPKDDIDVRVHGRYYRDPPEFLTFMHGGSDGLHYGLWFDDGHKCIGVGSYYNNDGGDVGIPTATPLEQVRTKLELVWRDLADYDEAETERGEAVSQLRETVVAYETGDRPEVGQQYYQRYVHDRRPDVDPGRLMTLDGAGALVTGTTTANRQPAGHPNEWMFVQYLTDKLGEGDLAAMVDEARRRCADGDPAEALTLGRDLHWRSGGDPERERYANELLVLAYRALGRGSLAEIAAAHHRHRDLPQVTVLR